MRKIPGNLVYRLFYPQVPSIICASFGKQLAAMPANSCIPISDSPPLVCVAINRKSRTNGIIARAGFFSVNWIDYSNRDIAKKLALPVEGSRQDKLSSSGVSYKIENHSPVITNSRAYLICRVKVTIRAGDHDLFIGKVIRAKAASDFSDYWKFKKYRPLLYLGSGSKPEYTTF